MARTNWKMGDTVQPDDLNQIGQEINDNTTVVSNHIAATSGVHGASSEAVPNRLVQRDTNGRFKAAAPAAPDDVARKHEVDTKLSLSGGTMTGNINSTLEDFSIGKTHDAGRLLLKGGSTGSINSGAVIQLEGADFGGEGNGGNLRLGVPLGKDVLINGNKAWHAGNDGVGSGLDADMLDGLHSEEFSTAVNAGYNEDPNTTEKAYIVTNHANSPIGGTFWHIRTFFYMTKTGNRAQFAIRYHNANQAFIRFYNNGTWSQWTEFITAEAAVRFVYGDNSRATIEYNDNLDAIEKSGFYYAATGHTNSPTNSNGQLIHVQRGSSAAQALQIFQPFNSDDVYFRKKNSTWGNWFKLAKFDSGTNKLYTSGAYTGVHANANAGTNVEYDGFINGVRRAILLMNESAVELRKYASNGSTIEKRLVLNSSNALIDGNTIWHGGNDGAGSGLDADKLDGMHSSSFWSKSELPIESGTFTPIILVGGSAGSTTYSYRNGFYQRIGDRVFFEIRIKISSKDPNWTSGLADVSGLPFVPKNESGLNVAVTVADISYLIIDSTSLKWSAFLFPGTNIVRFARTGNNTMSSALTANYLTNSTGFLVSGSYRIN